MIRKILFSANKSFALIPRNNFCSDTSLVLGAVRQNAKRTDMTAYKEGSLVSKS